MTTRCAASEDCVNSLPAQLPQVPLEKLTNELNIFMKLAYHAMKIVSYRPNNN